jgi:hypothetical protein
MKTKYIIIIFIIVIICLSSSSLASYQYIKKNNTNNEIYNNNIDEYCEERINTEKEIYHKNIVEYNKNIDEYNQKYNMNYNDGKIYYNDDLKNMIQTVATVISDSELKDIIVNNKMQDTVENDKIKDIVVNDRKIKLFRYTISYKIRNYFSEKQDKIILLFGFDASGGIPSFSISPCGKPLENDTNVITNIITTIPIENNQITVYYNYGSIGRFFPPFLPENYVTYLNKK